LVAARSEALPTRYTGKPLPAMTCARATSTLPPEQRIAAAYAIWFAVVDVIRAVVMPVPIDRPPT